MKLWSLALLFLQLCITNGMKTLVFVDDNADMYSDFLDSLKASGHEVDVRESSNKKNFIFQLYGEFIYDNLVVLAPSANRLGLLSKQEMHDFVEKGGNVVISASTKLSKMQRGFAEECGVEYFAKGESVLDAFHGVESGNNMDGEKFYAKDFGAVNTLMDVAFRKGKVVFEGTGQMLDAENVLGFSLLKPERSAYVLTKADVHEKHVGQGVSLVSAVQGRNNARILFSGSLELFKNEQWRNKDVVNMAFTKAITEWTFGQRGVLKVSNRKHRREDGSSADKMLKNVDRPDQPVSLYPDAEICRESLVYRIKDNLTYSFDVVELKNGKWEPFQADDMQMEFVMLDPYVRKTISHDKKGHFSVTFQAPDVYGIFQFRVMYRRLGYSTIHFTDQVSVRPFKHDEYERYIVAAFPYYASAFSMMTGIFLFSIIFLFSSSK